MEKPDYQLKELVADLVDKLDDYQRDVRDWSEVEPILNKVRDEVRSPDENPNRDHATGR